MDWVLPIVAIIGGLLVVMAVSTPIAFAFLFISLIGAAVLQGPGALPQTVLSIISTIDSFSVVTIPLFILMGVILWHSRLGNEAFETLDKCMGRMPARLSFLTLGSGGIFAALSGSTIANTAMLGTMLYPDLRRRGYSNDLSAGIIIASGGLAMMIPPSALAVILAAIGRISVAKVLTAAVVPGLILAGMYCLYILGRTFFFPASAPSYEPGLASWREKVGGIFRHIAPLGIIMFAVTGFIVLGIATPTEAGAMGALGSIVLVIAKGRMSRALIVDVLTETMQITVMVFAIIGMATAFTQVLAYSGATSGLLQTVLGMDVSPIILFLGMQVVVFILGCFMEQIAIMLITLPIFIPIVVSTGHDPVWFGVLMLVNLETAAMTPPFGLSLMVMKGVAPELTFSQIARASAPFLVCNIIVMLLLLVFPGIVTEVLAAFD